MAQIAEQNYQDTSLFMGLESSLSQQMCKDVGHIRRAILSEHSRQSRSGIHDPDAMAAVSQALSESARKRARIIGLIHAEK
ncbi:hypothetical protein ACHAXR_012469 [Thalassiosira sp. AJA248-18]